METSSIVYVCVRCTRAQHYAVLYAAPGVCRIRTWQTAMTEQQRRLESPHIMDSRELVAEGEVHQVRVPVPLAGRQHRARPLRLLTRPRLLPRLVILLPPLPLCKQQHDGCLVKAMVFMCTPSHHFSWTSCAFLACCWQQSFRNMTVVLFMCLVLQQASVHS